MNAHEPKPDESREPQLALRPNLVGPVLGVWMGVLLLAGAVWFTVSPFPRAYLGPWKYWFCMIAGYPFMAAVTAHFAWELFARPVLIGTSWWGVYQEEYGSRVRAICWTEIRTVVLHRTQSGAAIEVWPIDPERRRMDAPPEILGPHRERPCRVACRWLGALHTSGRQVLSDAAELIASRAGVEVTVRDHSSWGALQREYVTSKALAGRLERAKPRAMP